MDTKLSSLSLQNINTSHSLKALNETVKAVQRAVKGRKEPAPVRPPPAKPRVMEVPDFRLSQSERSLSGGRASPPPTKKTFRRSPSPHDSPAEPPTCEKRSKATAIQNVRNFDDFRSLLENLKLTISNSNYSSFNESASLGFHQLETELDRYNTLDRRIDTVLESLPQDKSGPLRDLEALRAHSNLLAHQQKLQDLQQNPSDFDSFLLKLKKELLARSRTFEDICFRHKLATD